jgi:hypothetical protein
MKKNKKSMGIHHLSLISIILVIACAHNKYKHDLHYELLEKTTAENESYVIYKINEDVLDKQQLAKLDSIRILSSELLIIPDPVHYEIFSPGTPYSPTPGFRFYLSNQDSINIQIKPLNESDDLYTSIISEILPTGYYLIPYYPKNLNEGVYNIKYRIGEKTKISRFILLK